MDAERLAAWLDSYRAGLREGLQTAAEQGFGLVQAGAATGELEPSGFSRSARRHLRRYLEDLGLRLDALALEYPGAGLAEPAHADQRVDQLKRTLELCADLRVPRTIVTLSGFDQPRTADLAQELLGVVADLADRFGIQTAVNSRTDPLEDSAGRVRRTGCRHLHLALDAAYLRNDEIQRVAQVADRIGTIHLRDVRRSGDQFQEVPFGQGEVDFRALLAQLEAGAGPPLVLRHDGPAGVDVLGRGREYIRALIGQGSGR